MFKELQFLDWYSDPRAFRATVAGPEWAGSGLCTRARVWSAGSWGTPGLKTGAPSLQSERRGTTPASGGPLAEEGKADSMGRGLSQMGETLAHTEDPEIKSK